MNRKIVRLVVSFAVAFAGVHVSAQVDETPTKKPTLSQAEREAKAKVREQRHRLKAKADAELKAKAVDINHASKAELLKLPGISDTFAAAIIAKRPFRSKTELVSKNAIPQGTYQGLHSLVVVR